METANESGFTVGWILGRVPPHALTATLLVKGTFDLKPGAPAVPSGKQELLDGDVEAEGVLRYPADVAWFKPRTDLLLVGTCHQPKGRAESVCSVVFQVGRWAKTLAVVGDRVRERRLLLFSGVSEPRPFVEMKLTWARAFGGPGYPKNPHGRELPNLLDPDRLYVDADSRPDPAGFGPIPLPWPQRIHKAGTYGGAWKKRHWPGLPPDADWTLFNSAPPDQQMDGHLRGDEPLLFRNLHRSVPVYESRLPGLRARWFVNEGAGLREVPLLLDTLWADMDAEKLILVWRGVTPVADQALAPIRESFVVREPLGEPRGIEHYASVLAALKAERAKPRAPRPQPPGPRKPKKPDLGWVARVKARVEEIRKEAAGYEKQLAEHKERLKRARGAPALPVQFPPGIPDLAPYHARIVQAIEKMKKLRPELAGVVPPSPADLSTVPPKPPEFKPRVPLQPRPAGVRWTPESALAAGPDALAGQDLRKLALAGADLRGRNLKDAVLAGADLSRARLGGADLSGADLSGADLTGADLEGALLRRADLRKARLGEARLSRASLDGADLGEAALARAKLDSASAVRARFPKADLSGADLRGADLSGADLAEARLEKADLRKALLRGVQAPKATGGGADFSEADLTKFAAGGADLSGARFRGARAPQSVWSEANLDGADFLGAALSRANFTGASLPKAVFSTADLRWARLSEANLAGSSLLKANLFRAMLAAADLRGADVRGSNLYEAELLDAKIEGAGFQESDLTGTKLA